VRECEWERDRVGERAGAHKRERDAASCGRRGACVATAIRDGKTYGGPAQMAELKLKTPDFRT